MALKEKKIFSKLQYGLFVFKGGIILVRIFVGQLPYAQKTETITILEDCVHIIGKWDRGYWQPYV